MSPIKDIHEVRKRCLNQDLFSVETLQWVEQHDYWNLWVPKKYGGLESTLSEGLKTLKSLARIDGSLGWTVTLCSGANYFIGNLRPEVAQEIFVDKHQPVCFGGSGGVFGTAEKQGENYTISGTWKYATGAPYLSHFTLNAKIMENGEPVLDENREPLIRSFVVPRNQVTVHDDWDTMGMKATATRSFSVNDVVVDPKYSFLYNRFYHPQLIYKIHFSVFADLTLWVNYIGMAEHYLEEASRNLEKCMLTDLTTTINSANKQVDTFVQQIEHLLNEEKSFSIEFIQQVHETASRSVKEISKNIIAIFPLLGIRSCTENTVLNQIFRDYFTATQHHIFSRKSSE
tara:strand:- start:38475 stop:39503 length:1029 start_codon:yes stop_codon:yes gene_type:complete